MPNAKKKQQNLLMKIFMLYFYVGLKAVRCFPHSIAKLILQIFSCEKLIGITYFLEYRKGNMLKNVFMHFYGNEKYNNI